MDKYRFRLTDEDYNFIYSRVPRLCVDLVIQRDDGVFLTLRSIDPGKNTWHLPGGRVFMFEKLEEAVRRIAKKETGLDVKSANLLGVMEFLKETQNGRNQHSVSLAYRVLVKNYEIKLDNQAIKAGYFKLAPSSIYPVHGEFLRNNGIIK